LGKLLHSRLPRLAPAAAEALQRLKGDDSRSVAAAAVEALQAHAPETAPPPSAAEQPVLGHEEATAPARDLAVSAPPPPEAGRSAPARGPGGSPASQPAVAGPPPAQPAIARARRWTGLWIIAPFVCLALAAVVAVLLAQGPLKALLPTAVGPATPDQPPIPGEFAPVVQTYVTNVSAVRPVALADTANDDWWFYDSSQPSLSGDRLTLPGSDDFLSAVVRRRSLGDNTGALLVFSLAGSATTSGMCEIGISAELDQITAYLLLCEDTFLAVAAEFGASELENVVPLSADPASGLQRVVDVEYGLLIARGLQNRLKLVVWPLDHPADQVAFSIDGHTYEPNYFFAKPYPGVQLAIRDYVEIEFESLN
jgi:hypothetical protein